jgi:hypothetical protein
MEPKKVVSSHWQSQRAKMSLMIEKVQTLDDAGRSQAWRSLASRCQSGRYTPELAYECACQLSTFVTELYLSKDGSYLRNAIAKTPGSDDPEFMRMCYIGLTMQRSSDVWGLLGPKLMKIYPEDILLKKGFVNESIFGDLPLEYRYQGRTILDRDLKSVYTEYTFIDLTAEMENRLYWWTSKRIHLDLGITFTENFIAQARLKRRSTVQAEAMLKVLKEQKAKGKYID